MALQGQRRSGDQSGVGTALSPTADIGGACLIFWQEKVLSSYPQLTHVAGNSNQI